MADLPAWLRMECYSCGRPLGDHLMGTRSGRDPHHPDRTVVQPTGGIICPPPKEDHHDA